MKYIDALRKAERALNTCDLQGLEEWQHADHAHCLIQLSKAIDAAEEGLSEVPLAESA